MSYATWERTKTLQDLDQAIRIGMENRIKHIDMKGKTLILKYEETREAVDIDTAVDFYENACNNARKGDANADEDTRRILSRNLSRALMLKYGDVTRDPTDPDRALNICKQAINQATDIVIKVGLDYLLSRLMLHKYEPTEDKADIMHAAKHSVQAFNRVSEDHPQRQEYLKNSVMMKSVKGSGRDGSLLMIPHMGNRSL